MKPVTLIFLIFLLFTFLSGIYFCLTHETCNHVEGMESNAADTTGNECPDLLIKSGNALLLYNSKMEEKPGVNPLPFYNLDEYINYLEIQRKKGIRCPVLFLQEENNTQGQTVYRIRPDVFNQQGGLPNTRPVYYNQFKTLVDDVNVKAIPYDDATIDNPPWNIGNYTGFDPRGQFIGQYTTLDALHDSTYKGKSISENPMDHNWGGVLYTKDAVDSGKYAENEVVPPSARGPFAEKSDNIRNEKLASRTSIFS
jgi:hypothetical protein